jgi:Tol biopolymer transport system component/predicted Ser/Thr protein kinase
VVGRTISHYKILERLGKGGMGEVWKAEDTRLRLTVALKFLGSDLLESEDYKTRLVREAQAAVSLDHPNICRVYGLHEEDGETFIAMAYIDGPSLADKIKQRPLPLDEAVDIACQIAEGLQEAHEQGIVHRDIKPHNVMLTSKGQVKIMDFGLALVSNRSRLTHPETTAGTPLYMAPEQLAGGEADRRADIWALGCVLYEMLTQQAPFEADYEQAIAYGILNEDPEPVTARRAGLPTQIDTILSKALAKDPAERYQTLGDLLVDLRALRKQAGDGTRRTLGPSYTGGGQDRGPSSPRWKAVGGYVAVGLLALLASRLLQRSFLPTGGPETRPGPRRLFSLRPQSPLQTHPGQGRLLPGSLASIAPDGSLLAYVDGSGDLWVWNLAQEAPRRIEGAGRAVSIFWMPDSRSVYVLGLSGIKRVAVESESVVEICGDCRSTSGAMSPDLQQVVFSDGSNLWSIPPDGSAPKTPLAEDLIKRVAEKELGSVDTWARWRVSEFLPRQAGPRSLIVSVMWPGSRAGLMMILDLEKNRYHLLGPGEQARYAPNGVLVYEQRNRDGAASIWEAPISLDRLELTGNPSLIRQAAQAPSVASDGTLAIVDWAVTPHELVWRDRSGKIVQTIGPGDRPRFSPDQSRVAYENNGSLFVRELASGAESPVVAGNEAPAFYPVWSPDGAKIAFSWMRSGAGDIYVRSVTRIGEEPSLAFASPGSDFPNNWSDDGNRLAYTTVTAGDMDLYFLEEDPRTHKWVQHELLKTDQPENSAAVSPDGNWVAYQAYIGGEGTGAKIYVEKFPPVGGQQYRISADRGIQARWSSDGRQLFFIGGRAPDVALYAVKVSTGAGFTHGAPVKLFSIPGFGANYDVNQDGSLFLLSEPQPQPELLIRILENWSGASGSR